MRIRKKKLFSLKQVSIAFTKPKVSIRHIFRVYEFKTNCPSKLGRDSGGIVAIVWK